MASIRSGTTSSLILRQYVPAVLVLLAFAYWRPDHSFFWRDDWHFLSALRTFHAGWFMEDHFGHVKPLFKLSYFLQLHVFGTNTIYYAYLNILFFALGNYAVFRLLRTIASTSAAWTMAIALTVHPVMFDHVGWSFEQCISLHLLFQVLAVTCFVQWTRSGTTRDLVMAYVLTVVQNYFFGNGLFLPLLFAAACLFLVEDGRKWKPLLAFVGLFLLFAVVQLLCGGDRAQGALSLSAVPGAFVGGVHLLGTDMARAFFFRETVFSTATPWLALAVFLAVVMLAVGRRDRDRRLAWFHVGWFLVAFCSIPIVSQRELLLAPIPPYYSVLCFIPLAMLVEHAVGGRAFLVRIPSRLLIGGGLMVMLLLFVIDRQLAGIIAFRSFRNEQAMMKSLQNGTPYHGFDDPYYATEPGRVPDPLGIYSYWRARDRFRSPFGYSGVPANWTEDRPVPR